MLKDYRAAVKKGSQKKANRTASQRSQASSSRSLNAVAVANRERRALESYERVLAINTEKNLETEMRAAEVTRPPSRLVIHALFRS